MITGGLGVQQVIDLALNKPEEYALGLHNAHASIASFGGMFLLMLCLHFFFDKKRKVRWIDIIEKPLQDMSRWWMYTVVCLATIIVNAPLLPINPHPEEGFVAGLVGIATYLVIHGLAELFSHKENRHPNKQIIKTGLAGFMAFLYLEVLFLTRALVLMGLSVHSRLHKKCDIDCDWIGYRCALGAIIDYIHGAPKSIACLSLFLQHGALYYRCTSNCFVDRPVCGYTRTDRWCCRDYDRRHIYHEFHRLTKRGIKHG